MDLTVTKVKQHETLKPLILKYIDEYVSPYETALPTISKTDWNTVTTRYMNRVEEEYLKLIKPVIDGELLESYNSKYFTNRIDVINYWFQQYTENNMHQWHNHPSAQFSNVYFVELPHGAPRTEFFDPVTREVIAANVKEGDILTFPAHLVHRSPPVVGDKRKTIVAFNTNSMIDLNKFYENF